MAERAYITVDRGDSPRLVEVANTQLINQDLHDTLRSNTLPAGDPWDQLDNMDDDTIIDSAGKEDLGGGVLVGITSSLLDAQIAFFPSGRGVPLEAGSATAGSTGAQTLIDSTATFITNGVERGDAIINWDDRSWAEILRVVSETELRTRPLAGGTTNTWSVTDAYSVFDIIQCDISGGNTVAVDDVGAPISAVFPTLWTQVVRTSSSSATLQELNEIRFATYQNKVTVDTVNGFAGTDYPIGTPLAPVNNIPDAAAIATVLGFDDIEFLGDLTLGSGDNVENFTLHGQSTTLSLLTIDPAAVVNGIRVRQCRVTGTLDGDSTIEDADIIPPLNFVEGKIVRCLLEAGTITLGGTSPVRFLDCWSGVAGSSTPTIDYSGSGRTLEFRRYSGGIAVQNKTGADAVSIDLSSGQVVLDSTVTAGAFVIRGTGKLTDNSTGTTTVDDTGLINQQSIAGAVWNSLIAGYQVAGSFGEFVSKKLLTFAKWLSLK